MVTKFCPLFFVYVLVESRCTNRVEISPLPGCTMTECWTLVLHDIQITLSSYCLPKDIYLEKKPALRYYPRLHRTAPPHQSR